MTTLEPLQKFNANAALARRNLKDFVSYTKPDYHFNWHHEMICQKLNDFTRGNVKKLMIFVPPQHGKSELATRRYPAFQLGINPTKKIAICSYSDTLSTSFNRDIQRIIDDNRYYDVFPNTYLNESNVVTTSKGGFLRNADIFETVNYRGFVKTVGVGGSLTGTPVDIGIIDDPFKDREEAMSIRIREKVYSWYTDVFATRLHNDSQQLLIMTRWDSDDLAGRILQKETDWDVIVFQAIKEKEIPNDPRQLGEALWPEKHSLERLLHIKETSPVTFNSLYQQEPKASREALVFPQWSEYNEEPEAVPVYGLDFGFSNDPTAIVQVKKVNKRLYVKEILYAKGLTNSDIYYQVKDIIRHAIVYADSAEPKSIEELRRLGLNIRPTVKGRDSITNGISWIKEHELFIHQSSYNLKQDLNNYQWIMHGGTPTNMPIDQFSHSPDAIRYTKPHFKTSVTSFPTFHNR